VSAVWSITGLLLLLLTLAPVLTLEHAIKYVLDEPNDIVNRPQSDLSASLEIRVEDRTTQRQPSDG
jgi:hypothetical protein